MTAKANLETNVLPSNEYQNITNYKRRAIILGKYSHISGS